MEPEPLRWSVLQRFRFIEQRLYWEGRFNKVDLIERFSVSPPQTTADVANYQRLAPGNMTYDAHAKTFLPTQKFDPRFMEPDARQYLSQLLLLADSVVSQRDTWLGMVPAHDAIPRVRRKLDPQKLRPIVSAIHNKRALRVSYQSMSTPDPTDRWIAPHALAFDGFRWHTRAWCYKKSTFIDLVLARFLSIQEERPAEIDPGMDREWHEIVVLELEPHPDLPPAQRRAIELDYGMENGLIKVSMRLSLFYYFEKHLCLDLVDLPAKRRQVVLRNKDEIEARKGQTSPTDA